MQSVILQFASLNNYISSTITKMKKILLVLFLNLIFISFTKSQNIHLDILLKNLTAKPLEFRKIAAKELGFTFVETKTFEQGTVAQDYFKCNDIALQKSYGLYTIVAAKGEGLENIYFNERQQRHLKDWNNNQENLATRLVITNVPDSLVQIIKAEAMAKGPEELHCCIVSFIEEGDYRRYCIQGKLEIKFTSHKKSQETNYEIEINIF